MRLLTSLQTINSIYFRITLGLYLLALLITFLQGIFLYSLSLSDSFLFGLSFIPLIFALKCWLVFLFDFRKPYHQRAAPLFDVIFLALIFQVLASVLFLPILGRIVIQ